MNKIEEMLGKLTVNEKAALLEGYESWRTNAVPRLGIPSIYMTDGPHGLRKIKNQKGGGFSMLENEPATSFPTSATIASSWNPENAYKAGRAIAEECNTLDVSILLAPGVNIKRSPLCGRNFEYYSEDPLLSGLFGGEFVKGLQDNGVGCSVKHFAANSNENYRFSGNSVVDERALREIYLKAFENIVKNDKPKTIMCSYNKLNGTYASENKKLLTNILREEWGFDGLVITDWGAATPDRVKGIKAGCDLDMPGSVRHNRKTIIEGVESGQLSIEELDAAVERVLKIVFEDKKKSGTFDKEDHAKLACEIARDSAVLLKNDGTLPLVAGKKMLVVGEMFGKMRFQGAGSSLVNPFEIITPMDAFKDRDIDFIYEKGYQGIKGKKREELADRAVQAADNADVVLFFGGLTDFEESEGFDREHMRMGDDQVELINRLAATGKKLVLVLFAGAPVELPFYDNVSAILNMYLPGMHGGDAAASLIFGEANPAGRLAESWPLKAEDTSCYADYNKSKVSRYYESIYVGYRFYDKKGTLLRFPFGYGLSYTTFKYENLSILRLNGKISVVADITNTGRVDGCEVMQVYAGIENSQVFRAAKELRGFTKLFIEAGETKRAKVEFEEAELAYWHRDEKAFVVENGIYEIFVGSNIEGIHLKSEVTVDGYEEVAPAYGEAVMEAYQSPPEQVPEAFREMSGVEIPKEETKGITIDSTLSEMKRTFFGKLFYRIMLWYMGKDYKKALKMPPSNERDVKIKNSYFLVKMLPSNTLRLMAMASGGMLSLKIARVIALLANGNVLEAFKTMWQREKVPLLPVEKG